MALCKLNSVYVCVQSSHLIQTTDVYKCSCDAVLTTFQSLSGTTIMLAVVVILAVCGCCSAQCSTTLPANLTIPPILTMPPEGSNKSKFY